MRDPAGSVNASQIRPRFGRLCEQFAYPAADPDPAGGSGRWSLAAPRGRGHAGGVENEQRSASDVIEDGGLRVVPMTPDLAGALDAFHETLTVATTRSRFFNVHPHLSPDELTRFSTVDHRDREALVALDPAGAIVAVARFDRLGGSSTAEVAVVVADDWQHRGIGAALFSRLAARAVELGVDQLVADTLAGNRPMRAVFRHAGFPCREQLEDGIVRVTIELADP